MDRSPRNKSHRNKLPDPNHEFPLEKMNRAEKILNDFSNRIDQIVQKNFREKFNKKPFVNENEFPEKESISIVSSENLIDPPKKDKRNASHQFTKKKESPKNQKKDKRNPENFAIYIPINKVGNPSYSNENQIPISCHIEHQNIINQIPYQSQQFPAENPPIINFSLNPIMAFQIPFAQEPQLFNNLAYSQAQILPQYQFPNQFFYHNQAHFQNRQYANYSQFYPIDGPFLSNFGYPEPTVLMNNFISDNQVQNSQFYQNQGNNFVKNSKNSETHLYTQEATPSNQSNFHERSIYYPSKKILPKESHTNIAKFGPIPKEKKNSDEIILFSARNQKKVVEENKERLPSEIADEFTGNNLPKNIPREPKKKNHLIDIFTKENPPKVQEDFLKAKQPQERKKWNKENPPNKQKPVELQEKVPSKEQQDIPKVVTFEINFEEKANVPLSEIFKNRKSKLLKKMEEQKLEKKEEKREKPVIQRTKEEILQQRREMMKKPDFIQSKPMDIQDEKPKTPKIEQIYIEHKAIKKGKEPPSDVLERLAMGIKPKVSKQEMYKLTLKNYEALPEVKKRKEEERKRNEIKQRQEKVRILEKKLRGGPSRNSSKQKIDL